MSPSHPRGLTVLRHSSTTIHYSVTDRDLPRTILGYILLFSTDLIRLATESWILLIIYIVGKQQWHEWQTSGIALEDRIAGLRLRDNGFTSSVQKPSLFDNIRTDITWQVFMSTVALPLDLFHARTQELEPLPPLTPSSSKVPLFFPIMFMIGAYILLQISRVTTESLLVMHTLGVQTSHRTTSFPIINLLAHRLANILPFNPGLEALFSTTTTRFIPTSQIQDVLIHEAFVGWEVRYYLAVVVKEEDSLVVVFEKLLPRLNVVQTVWKGVREVLWEDNKKGKLANTGDESEVDHKTQKQSHLDKQSQ